MKLSFFKVLRGSEGLTLFVVIFVMAFFLIFVAGGLFFAQLNLKTASNFQLATQAVEVADAGLQHALAVVPWVWDFNAQLNCSTPPCVVKNPDNSSISNTPFASGFTYTVTAKNDPADANPTNDTNSRILLTSQANGPGGTTKTVEAYVRRSLASFTPPAAFYVNAVSSYPTLDSSTPAVTGYFDIDESLTVKGVDTNYDGSFGPKPALYGIATTSGTITDALKDAYNPSFQCLLGLGATPNSCPPGVGSTPSIRTVGDILDIDALADKFFNQPGAVKFLTGLQTTCPSTLPTPRPNPDPCNLGTLTDPKVTYIKQDTAPNVISLNGNVKGYGVLVLEGEATIKGLFPTLFRFYGLIIHKRSAATHYLSIEDDARVYGAVLLGAYDEGDGMGKKARFGLKDNVRIYYSSQGLSMVDSNWGSLLPKPPRLFAWLDK